MKIFDTVNLQVVAALPSAGTKGRILVLSTDNHVYHDNGTTWDDLSTGGGDALVASPLSQFAQTTSLQLKNTISDETGSGALVFATSPTLITPALGEAAASKITIASNTQGLVLGANGTNSIYSDDSDSFIGQSNISTSKDGVGLKIISANTTLRFVGDVTSGYGYFQTGVTGGSNAGKLFFSGINGTDANRVELNAVTQYLKGKTGIGVTTPTGVLHLKAGTADANTAPLKYDAGTILTTPESGTLEYDGVASYITNETTSGRGAIPVEQHFKLTAAGATIGTTIANYFGANSNISLAPNGIYEIEIELFYQKTTAGTVTWTLTNTAAPISQNIIYRMSPLTGISATDVATYLERTLYNDTTAARTVVTGSLTNNTNQYAYFKIFLINSTGTSLKIQTTTSAGTITPGIGSRWFVKRLPVSNVGTFAA